MLPDDKVYIILDVCSPIRCYSDVDGLVTERRLQVFGIPFLTCFPR